MYRVCLEKATGKLIEMQSGGTAPEVTDEQVLLAANREIEGKNRQLTKGEKPFKITDDLMASMRVALEQKAKKYKAACLDTLLQNALAAGYKKTKIEVKFVDEKGWQQILADNDTSLNFLGQKVFTKADVDKITSERIAALGEDRAKTEKLLAGTKACAIWDDFITARTAILKEGDKFITANKLE